MYPLWNNKYTYKLYHIKDRYVNSFFEIAQIERTKIRAENTARILAFDISKQTPDYAAE